MTMTMLLKLLVARLFADFMLLSGYAIMCWVTLVNGHVGYAFRAWFWCAATLAVFTWVYRRYTR